MAFIVNEMGSEEWIWQVMSKIFEPKQNTNCETWVSELEMNNIFSHCCREIVMKLCFNIKKDWNKNNMDADCKPYQICQAFIQLLFNRKKKTVLKSHIRRFSQLNNVKICILTENIKTWIIHWIQSLTWTQLNIFSLFSFECFSTTQNWLISVVALFKINSTVIFQPPIDS